MVRIYEVDNAYVDYLSSFEPRLFHKKQPGQRNERKYVGVVLTANGYNYFAPLSSFKEKHRRMCDALDFIKVRSLAVINLNNMFPVPDGLVYCVDFSSVQDTKYRALLQSEWRYIKSIQDDIVNKANALYKLKLSGKINATTQRCCDFTTLECLCAKYRI